MADIFRFMSPTKLPKKKPVEYIAELARHIPKITYLKANPQMKRLPSIIQKTGITHYE
jgi:hypothetical protein